MSDRGQPGAQQKNSFRGWMGQDDRPPAVVIQTDNSGGNNPSNPKPSDKNNTDPNSSNDDALLDNIWSDVQKETPPVDNTNPAGNPPAPAAPAQVDPNVQVANYLKEKGLEQITLTEAQKEGLKTGDPTVMQDLLSQLNGKIVKAHVEAMRGSQTMIQTAVKDAVAEAMKNTTGYVEGKEMREAMQAALPFTKNPNIGPVAETIMKRMMDRGANQEQALKGVDKWFRTTMMEIDPSFAPNKNTGDGFRKAYKPSGNSDTDWLKALRGQ